MKEHVASDNRLCRVMTTSRLLLIPESSAHLTHVLSVLSVLCAVHCMPSLSSHLSYNVNCLSRSVRGNLVGRTVAQATSAGYGARCALPPPPWPAASPHAAVAQPSNSPATAMVLPAHRGAPRAPGCEQRKMTPAGRIRTVQMTRSGVFRSYLVLP